MKLIDLAQGSVEWERWRTLLKIGASDAPAIMGCGYVSHDELMQEKLGLKKRKSTYEMRRGIDLEPRARFLFEEATGLVMPPAVGQHDELEWMVASFDGLSLLRDQVLEIKTANTEYHAMALQGKVPDRYYPQVQHQLFVSDADVCHYWSYSENKLFGSRQRPSTALVEVTPDSEFLAKLLDAEEAFWRDLQAARLKVAV